jgi:hypothetical protein
MSLSAKDHHVQFYVRDIKTFLQCVQLFKSESAVQITLSVREKSITVFSLIQSNIAVLQIVFVQGKPDVSILIDIRNPQNQATVQQEDIILHLDTKTFIKALSEIVRFESAYCIIQPSKNRELVICTAMDKNNREVVCHRIHCINHVVSSENSINSIDRPDCKNSVTIYSTGKQLSEYFATGEDTTISTEPNHRRLVWTVNDTLLNTRRFHYLTTQDCMPSHITQFQQTYIKSIMLLIRHIFSFMSTKICAVALLTDTPIHIFNTNITGVQLDFLAGFKDDDVIDNLN